MLKRFGTFSTAEGCCSMLCSAVMIVELGWCLPVVFVQTPGSTQARMLEFLVGLLMGIPKWPLRCHCLLKR